MMQTMRRCTAVTVLACAALAAQAAPVTWIGAAGGEWFNAGNWSSLAFPGPLDTVTIGTAGLVYIDGQIGGDAYALSLHSQGGLEMRGAGLWLDAPSSVAGLLDAAHSTLGGSGTLAVAGNVWLRDTEVLLPLSLGGGASFVGVTLDSTLTTTGSATIVQLGINGGSWVNTGTLTLASGLDSSTHFDNRGSVVQQHGAAFGGGFVNSGSYQALGAFTVQGGFVNSGTLTLDSVALDQLQASAASLANSGTIAADSVFINRSWQQQPTGRLQAGLMMQLHADVEGGTLAPGVSGLVLDAATLRGAAIEGRVDIRGFGGVLDAVVLRDGAESFEGVVARNGIRNEGASTALDGLLLDGSQPLHGAWHGQLAATPGTTITLAADAQLTNLVTSAPLVNRTHISGIVAVGDLVNEAGARVDASGPMAFIGQLTNRGVVRYSGPGELVLAGARTDEIGDFKLLDGATLRLTRSLDNTGRSFDLASLGGMISVQGGELRGGQFSGSAALAEGFDGALVDVTFDGPLVLNNFNRLTLAGRVRTGEQLVLTAPMISTLVFAAGTQLESDLVLRGGGVVGIADLQLDAGRRLQLDGVAVALNGWDRIDGLIQIDRGTLQINSFPNSGSGSGQVVVTAGTLLRLQGSSEQVFQFPLDLRLEPGGRLEFFPQGGFRLLPGSRWELGGSAFGWVVDFYNDGWMRLAQNVTLSVVHPDRGTLHQRGELLLDAGAVVQATNLLLLEGSTLTLALHDAASFAQLAVVNHLALGGMLNIVATPGAQWEAGTQFVIGRAATIEGQFAGGFDPALWQLDYGDGLVTLTALQPVPEPPALLLLLAGLGALGLRRQRWQRRTRRR